MKLFDAAHYKDYGHEFFFQLLSHYPKFALVDLCFQIDEFPTTEIFPAISLSIGSSHLLGFFIRYKRFEFDLSVITARPRDLEWYRRNFDD